MSRTRFLTCKINRVKNRISHYIMNIMTYKDYQIPKKCKSILKNTKPNQKNKNIKSHRQLWSKKLKQIYNSVEKSSCNHADAQALGKVHMRTPISASQGTCPRACPRASRRQSPHAHMPTRMPTRKPSAKSTCARPSLRLKEHAHEHRYSRASIQSSDSLFSWFSVSLYECARAY